MQIIQITKEDLNIEIASDNPLTFDWSAEYISSTVMSIDLSINRVLLGNEICTIKFINYKTFRGPYGG